MNELSKVRHRPFGPNSARFLGLLKGYPELAHHQVHELVSLYPHLTIVEIALLASDEGVAARFDAFYRDHVSGPRWSWRTGGAMLLLAIAGCAAIATSVWLVVG
jgi:hypothetical protein